MKQRIIVMVMTQVMALAFCASVAQAEPGNIPVGSMQLVPTLTLGESYNDNIFSNELKKDMKKSWITKIEPSFILNADDGAKHYELGYKLSDSIYHQSRGDDVINHFVNFNADLELSRKLTAAFYANYNLSHDPRGLIVGAARNVIVPDAYREGIVGGSVDYGSNAHVIVSGEYKSKKYSNNFATTNLRNWDATKVGAEFDYDLTAKTSALLEVRYQRFNYLTALLDSTEQAYFAGLNWDATAKTSGSARMGYTKKNFAVAGTPDVGLFSWEVNVEWLPMSYSSWTLGTSSKPVESQGTGNVIKNNNVDLSWNHAWSDLVSHSASLGYSKDDYQGNTRLDNTTTASVSVNYQWLRWLAIQPKYDYSNLSSNIVNSSYKANVWMLNLIGTL